jgi:hypothetical protein
LLQLRPDLNFALQEFFDIADGDFTTVKNPGGQSGFNRSFLENFLKMLDTTGTAGSDNRYTHRVFDGPNQFQVKAHIGSIPIDAI